MIVAALLVPAVAGLLLVALRSRVGREASAWTGAAALAVTLLLLVLAWASDDHGLVDEPWIDALGARFHVQLTGLSWALAMMTALLGLLCCVWSTNRSTSPALTALVLLVCTAAIGVFVSLDLLLFFVFFELALVPMWFVIAWWGDPDDPVGRRRAATRFLLFTVTGSGLMLVGIALAALSAGSLQVPEIAAAGLDGSRAVLAATLITIGFAVKTPLVPLHTWLPDAHGKAPTVGSVLLAGVFLKLGTYGMLLLGATMLRPAFAEVAPFVAVLGVVGIVWAGLACLVQDDLKRLVAYSSIGHMGFVALAISTASDVGAVGAVVGSVAHGLITGMLFLLAGSLKDRYGSTSLAVVGRGLYSRTPLLAGTLLLAAVASAGLPGLAGFWGELLALRAAYQGGVLAHGLAWACLVVAALGIVLATAYLGRVVRLVAQGEPTPDERDRDLDLRERVVLGVLALLVLVLGVAPGLLAGAVV